MVQCNADGISRLILIGSEGGKRKLYFEKAAVNAGLSFSFYDWKDFPPIPVSNEPSGCFKPTPIKECIVKIDAPEWESSRLDELDELTGQYTGQLLALSQMPFGAFFNHPCDIAELLDKRKCKEKLLEHGISVTKMYGESFSHGETLLDFMRENRINQVFIKPVKGSGAAGVSALRVSHRQGRLALYTCAAIDKVGLVNTKKMYRLEGKDGESFLDRLLKLDCIIEKWHRKAEFNGYCYDLRVIVQDKKIDYILPRLSKGPITNLHLNNHSMDFAALNLDRTVVDRISELCIRAAQCYPGLKSIGMDVLLEKEGEKPYIIEMNAQGDLLHRDIYGENRIYTRQIEIIKEMLSGPVQE